MSRVERRIGDMDNETTLVLLRQEDGDVVVSITQKDGTRATVEFCAPGPGGGRSPKTHGALVKLQKAMQEDNEIQSSR